MPSNKAAQAALAGNNLIIALAVISFIVIGVTVFADKALISSIMLDQKILTAKQTADTKLSENLTNAPQLVQAYNSLGSLTRIVSDALPNTKDMPSVLVTLENMGGQSGLKIRSVAPTSFGGEGAAPESGSGGVGVPDPQSFRVAVTFDGSYPALLKFMKAVELSVRPMKVVDLQLNGSGSALTGQIVLQTYYQEQATLPIVMETVK